MAQDSMVDEMMDVGSGLNDALGCAVAAIFYIGSTIIFFTTSVILIKFAI